MTDTTHAAEQVRLAAVRARLPEQRLRDAIELSEFVHAALFARLRARHPTRSTVELALQLGGEPDALGAAEQSQEVGLRDVP